MKPRIYLGTRDIWGGRWVCEGNGYAATGVTPRLAYSAWRICGERIKELRRRMEKI